MAAELAGVPSVSIVTTGFLGQARAIAQALGIQELPVAEYPGVVAMDSDAELEQKTREILFKNILDALMRPVKNVVTQREPGRSDIVFEGTLDEVQEFFNRRQWGDGLPVIPPTLDRVERFLKFTSRVPEERIGILLPENREATVWNVAVNGVMAGCRPEYMPVLLAVVEAITDPHFRIQDAGSTPGWEPIVILSGPIMKQLDFNYETGVMRVGRQANTSVGRFLRLYMRNVAGLRILPSSTDKATFGDTFNLVMPENEDIVAELGWEPFSVTRGFQRGDNIVTVQSVAYASAPIASGGDKAKDHLDTLVEVIGGAAAPWTHMAVNWRRFFPLIALGPSVARQLAREGLSKRDIAQYLYDHTKVTAGSLERLAWQGGMTLFNLPQWVKDKEIPEAYYQSDDPERLVPVFFKPEWIEIIVSGDEGRNRSRGYIQNHEQGEPVSRRIELPPDWEQLLKSG